MKLFEILIEIMVGLTFFLDTNGIYDGVEAETISIFHGCIVWIEISVTRVTDRHHEACLVMPNSDPE